MESFTSNDYDIYRLREAQQHVFGIRCFFQKQQGLSLVCIRDPQLVSEKTLF